MFKNIFYNIFFIFLWFCDLVFAETNNIADAFLQAATHAPHPIQAAASMAKSASCLEINV
jgi:hypothetical protein